jgi:hypothetical protein
MFERWLVRTIGRGAEHIHGIDLLDLVFQLETCIGGRTILSRLIWMAGTARFGSLRGLPNAVTLKATKCHLVPLSVSVTREMSLG